MSLPGTPALLTFLPSEFTVQFIDLAEQTRLLGQRAPALQALCDDIEQVRGGNIGKPVDEIAPIALRAQELALQCTRQLQQLADSQYAAMKGGQENLAHLAETTAQVSLAASMCTLAIHTRTDDADETPQASRRVLADAVERLKSAATTYPSLAQRLSFRLASAAAQREDEQLLAQAPTAPGATRSPAGPPSAGSAPVPDGAARATPRRPAR
ncbi:hypothetical protein AB0J38_24920 [Streptomyces sp. NPDC050095]|uniref:hypothetical protein n=1 Tax=unclassified Streptomyces TaxID=2593676 RepID=UPI003423303C